MRITDAFKRTLYMVWPATFVTCVLGYGLAGTYGAMLGASICITGWIVLAFCKTIAYDE